MQTKCKKCGQQMKAHPCLGLWGCECGEEKPMTQAQLLTALRVIGRRRASAEQKSRDARIEFDRVAEAIRRRAVIEKVAQAAGSEAEG